MKEILATVAFFAAIALAGGMVATSCTTQARQTAAAGVVAALDCEALHLDGAVMADLRALADAKVQGWITGQPSPAALADKVKADLAPIKSDAGHCAMTGALAAATTLVAPPAPVAGTAVSALSVPGPDPAAVRVAFQVAARTLGWAPVKITGGDVL